jgi:fumarate reductase flavoprotein subunit
MNIIECDVVIVGAGGAGLRAAIEVAKNQPDINLALISKVYPMRSHTVAAEGGAAGVSKDEDSYDHHFNDTVSGGDWLCDQDAVEYFVKQAPRELTQMEHWGCPWSREEDGKVAVRPFGGMKVERTWYAADKTGFHMLHTLFQTSLKYTGIKRYDEYYSTELICQDGKCHGLTALDMRTGQMQFFKAKAVIICTGGAGRIFPFTTNGAIKTGDGMAMAYRAGVALKDMEFVQYHPTGLPGTGILITEGSRGEGGILVNKEGYRYLQDYNLGPADPWPRKKAMELGPRDRLSQAFWHEQKKGNTIQTDFGDAVHLDLRHLGEAKITERLPMVRELAMSYMSVDPVKEPIPVRPVVHYTMGGIDTDINTATSIKGLYAAGECACVSINGANRLGSNSLTELLVFGAKAGQKAAEYVASENTSSVDDDKLMTQAQIAIDRVMNLFKYKGNQSIVAIRNEMNNIMEAGAGIYRDENSINVAIEELSKLKKRFADIELVDKSNVYNTDLIQALELGSMIDIARAMAVSALHRKESRGSHQRLDFAERNDVDFLKHSLAYYQGQDNPTLDFKDVTITKSQPAERVYGGKSDE